MAKVKIEQINTIGKPLVISPVQNRKEENKETPKPQNIENYLELVDLILGNLFKVTFIYFKISVWIIEIRITKTIIIASQHLFNSGLST